MKYLALVLYFTLTFGFIELSHLNEEQPSYVLLFKSGTKRDSQAQLKGLDSRRPFRLKCLRNVTLPYIPPIEFGRKRETLANALMERNVGPPYIPPIEFGRKRETSNTLMKKQVGPPYIPPIEFGRKRESRQHLKEKLRIFSSKRE